MHFNLAVVLTVVLQSNTFQSVHLNKNPDFIDFKLNSLSNSLFNLL